MKASKTDVFLARITIQIKDHHGKKNVYKEMKGHLEDRIEDFILQGYSFETSELKAIEAFGDPTEIGKAFNKLYNRWTRRLRNIMVLIIGWNVAFTIGPFLFETLQIRLGNAFAVSNSVIEKTYSNFNVVEDVSLNQASFTVGNSKVVIERALRIDNNKVFLIARSVRVNPLNAYGTNIFGAVDVLYNDKLSSFSGYIPGNYYNSNDNGLTEGGSSVSPYWVCVLDNASEIPNQIVIQYQDMTHNKTFTIDLERSR